MTKSYNNNKLTVVSVEVGLMPPEQRKLVGGSAERGRSGSKNTCLMKNRSNKIDQQHTERILEFSITLPILRRCVSGIPRLMCVIRLLLRREKARQPLQKLGNNCMITIQVMFGDSQSKWGSWFLLPRQPCMYQSL